MRTRRNVVGLVIAGVIALALTGCVRPPPHVIPTSESSSKPVFATDAAALAAAKKAYAAYLAVSDEVAHDGGQRPDRFASVVTKGWLPKEVAAAGALATSKRTQRGSTKAADVTLQQGTQRGNVVLISIYVCLDLSQVQYVDVGTGLNPSPLSTSLVPVEVDLTSSSSSASKLLVERNTPWQGSDFCPQS
jgi:hypothetical protein